MALNIDFARALRRPTELQDLVEAVLQAAAPDETDWIEWKSFRSLTTVEGRADAARHIVGFANRHPDRAARNLEGCAYLIIGVEPGRLFGTDRLDPADVEAGLRPYLGDPGPQWSFHNVSYQESHVALFVVESPRWGDPIYCLEREFGKYQAGTVFVRRMASTHAASPADLSYLQERLLRRSDQIQVEVSWKSASHEVTPLDLDSAAIDQWIDLERVALLAPLATPTRKEKPQISPKQPVDLGRLRETLRGMTFRELKDLKRRQAAGESLTDREQARLDASQAHLDATEAMVGRSFRQPERPEDRSPDQYRQEVEVYLRAAREAATQAAINEAIERGLIHLQAAVSNSSDRNFPQVEVELYISGPVTALDDDEPRIDEFPSRPRLYGTPRPSPLVGWSGLVTPPLGPYVPRIRGVSEVTIDNSGSARLRFRPVDLRPKRWEELASFHLLVPVSLAGQSLSIAWTATSSGADGQAGGSLPLRVRSTPVTLRELLSQPATAEG
jgi:hypothetical protein